MYDSLDFEDGFTHATETDVEFSSVPTWHAKNINPPEDNNQFRVRPSGQLEVKQDGEWSNLDISGQGTIYKSVGGVYHSFQVTFDEGAVTNISLEQKGEP